MDWVANLARRWFGRQSDRVEQADGKPSPALSFHTADTSLPPTPSPNEPLSFRKTKRKRNDNDIAEFLAMIAEAVDRDEARKGIESQLEDLDDDIDELRKRNEEQTQRVDYLKTKAEGVAALQEVIASKMQIIETDEADMTEFLEMQRHLKRRLRQSRDQLSKLMDLIYSSLPRIVHSMDERGTLPNFFDESGGLREGAVLPMLLMSDLRCAAACSFPVKRARTTEEEARQKYRRVCASLRMASSVKSRQRWLKLRSARLDRMCRDADECNSMVKTQERREREMLSGSAKSFLTELGFFNTARTPSEVSSTTHNEDAGSRQHESSEASEKSATKIHSPDDEESSNGSHIFHKDTSPSSEKDSEEKTSDEDEDESSSSTKKTPSEGDKTPEELFGIWQHSKQELLDQRKHLNDYIQSYHSHLFENLYAYPLASKATLDSAFGTPPDEAIQEMTNALREIEQDYEESRAAAEAAGIAPLPSFEEVARTDEGSIASHFKSSKIAARKLAVGKYQRGVEKARPDGPNGSLGGAKGRNGRHSPAEYEAMSSVTSSEAVYGDQSPNLKLDELQQRLKRVEDERERLRAAILAMSNRPKYVASSEEHRLKMMRLRMLNGQDKAMMKTN